MKYMYTTGEYLGMIPQNAVKQCFIDAPGYNAAWDYCITPQGRHFISCCAEGTFPEYVKLYEYLPECNEMKLCFDMETSLVVYPRTIRPSKIHTSVNPMPDGRLIMTTHTTASAPTHPCWMPEAYYSHIWEGFKGSNVIIYDPDTGKVEDLGIPVPRDTIYGARYLADHNCLFFTTYIRGHAYLFDLKDRSVKDYGQCTEFGVYHLANASDGNIYFTTRGGAMWKFDTTTLVPQYTGINVPEDNTKIRAKGKPNCGVNRNMMAYSATGTDGRLYFTVHINSRFFVYDPRTNQLETLGPILPEELEQKIPYAMILGMAFDKYGKLWYGCGSDPTGLRLLRLDIMKPGAMPEDFGLIGVPNRIQTAAENIFISGDVLYLSDTNHGPDTPGIVSIDLEKVRNSAGEPRVLCQDVIVFWNAIKQEPETEKLYRGNLMADSRSYREFLEQCARDTQYLSENPFRVGKERYVCKLWKTFGTEGSQVLDISCDQEGNVLAWISAQGGICVTLRDGEILKYGKAECIPARNDGAKERSFEAYSLPAQPGRQYLATVTAFADLADGSVLAGTKDGMLALIRQGKVFGLGSVCDGGAVHDMAVTSDGRRVYGVAGDPDSLGMIFCYDNENGLHLLGWNHFEDGAGKESIGVSCEPCCIAISPDDTRIAVGMRDHLGCAYELEI